MNILGISCHYHDSAACLVRDGQLVAAAQEERFTRRKNCADFPIKAVNACLQEGGISPLDIDHVVFYEKPYLKFSRVVIDHLRSWPCSFPHFLSTMPAWLQDRLIMPIVLRRELGFNGNPFFVKHHLAHAASSFLVSPFDRAAVITSDSVGEWASTTVGCGEGNSIRVDREIRYPDSLGLLYTAVTTYLGFEAMEGEGKVMGLASYGKPRYIEEFKKLIDLREDGSYRLDQSYFGFNTGRRMYGRKFVKLFGAPRVPESPLDERFCDIAATLQRVTEDALIAIAREAHRATGSENLCLAGGTFLNCVANSRIMEETPFKNVFIQPASGDAGGALGAAMAGWNMVLGKPRGFVMEHACWGPQYTATQVRRALTNAGLAFREMTQDEMTAYVARRIAENKIVGWFQGRMEFGPRALGSRSILANPCDPGMKDYLNNRVKHREEFRPFAPAALEEKAGEYFHNDRPSPFMLLSCAVRAEKQSVLPAVTHVDGSARLQTVDRTSNPVFRKLIEEFEKVTGVPVVLNTSFNLRGEPVVCTPEDAINDFKRSDFDCLAIEKFVVEK